MCNKLLQVDFSIAGRSAFQFPGILLPFRISLPLLPVMLPYIPRTISARLEVGAASAPTLSRSAALRNKLLQVCFQIAGRGRLAPFLIGSGSLGISCYTCRPCVINSYKYTLPGSDRRARDLSAPDRLPQCVINFYKYAFAGYSQICPRFALCFAPCCVFLLRVSVSLPLGISIHFGQNLPQGITCYTLPR